MTNLKCSAEGCRFNRDHRCSLSDIRMEGADSATRLETSCASFLRKSKDNENLSKCAVPDDKTEIRCTAERCVHNTGSDRCSADCVCVGVQSPHAHKGELTRCDTFAPSL